MVGWVPFDPPVISLQTFHVQLETFALTHGLAIKINICIMCGERKRGMCLQRAVIFSQCLHGTLLVLLCGHTAAHGRFPHNYCTQTDVKGSQNKRYSSRCPAQLCTRSAYFNHPLLLVFFCILWSQTGESVCMFIVVLSVSAVSPPSMAAALLWWVLFCKTER